VELLFAGLAGILIGIAARYSTPNRQRSGALLVPAVGGGTALVLWEAFTWLGTAPGLEWLAYDAGWIWWLSLGLTALVTFLAALSLGRSRAQADDDLFQRLRHMGRASV